MSICSRFWNALAFCSSVAIVFAGSFDRAVLSV
jgi:hypothetical protein